MDRLYDQAEPAGTLVGATLGNYQVTAQIGRGGMGAVYRAVDRRLGREVAIKSLLSEETDPRGRKRLMDEARRASRVSSPYVATVFDVVEQGDRCYIVMEAIDGRRLDAVLRLESPGNAELTRYATEIAEALAAIHAAGIIHRDLKPANVMITDTGHVKVMDFGLAKDEASSWLDRAGQARPSSTTESSPGAVAGTIAYMSPEQLRGERLDGRSDLFAFGTVLREAITGRHPFQRDSVLETASAILHQPPAPRVEGGPVPPPALFAISERLLEKDRDRRYASAEHVRADLSALVEPAPRKRPRWLPWAAAAAAVALAAIAWTLRPAPSPPARPVVAVLPFEDKTGEPQGDRRAELLADLIATGLADSQRVRPLGGERVREIVAGAGPRATPSRLVQAVTAAADVRWVITGTVFKEGETYHATLTAQRPGQSVPDGSYRVSAAGCAAMAERAGAILRDELFGERADAAATAIWASTSEEAQLLEREARKDLRELRYRAAIEKLERALALDPAFLPAKVRLAEALDGAGYGARAREAADRAVRDVEALGASAARSSLALEAKALGARTHDDATAEIEARRALVLAHGDDPVAHLTLANALKGRGEYAESLAQAQLALALDPKDPVAHLAEGAAFVGARRFAEASASFARADEAFQAIGSAAGRAVVTSASAEVSFRSARYEEARLGYEAAAAAFAREGLGARAARARKGAADALVFEGKLDEAASIYDDILGTMRSVGDTRMTIRILESFGSNCLASGRYDDAERLLRKARNEALPLGNPKLLATPTMGLASVLGYTGRSAESGALAQEALGLARESGNLEVQTGSLVLLGDALDAEGRIDEAIAAYREIVDSDVLAKAAGAPVGTAFGRLADLLRDRGRLGDALEATEDALAIERGSDKKLGLGYALVNRAISLADLGSYADAAKDTNEAVGLAAAEGATNRDLELQATLVRAMLAERAGRWDEAERLLTGLRDGIESAGAGWLRFGSYGLSASVALSRRKPADALRHARRAVAASEHMPRYDAQARSLLAQALAAAGERREADQEAGRAAEAAGRLDLPLPLAQACAVLAESASSPEARDAARARGRSALERYLDGAPEARRDAVRARKDLASLFERLG